MSAKEEDADRRKIDRKDGLGFKLSDYNGFVIYSKTQK